MRHFLFGAIAGAAIVTSAVAAAATRPYFVPIHGGQTPILVTADHPEVDFRWQCLYNFRKPGQTRLAFTTLNLRPGEDAWAGCSLYPNGASSVTWSGADFSVWLTSRRAIALSQLGQRVLWQRTATHRLP